MLGQFFRIPHKRLGIVAIGKANSPEEAIELARADDPCWREIAAADVQFGGNCTDSAPSFVTFRSLRTPKETFPSKAMRPDAF